MKGDKEQMTEKSIDDLLKEALSERRQPDPLLQQKILCQWGRTDKRRRRPFQRMLPVLAALGVLSVSVTAGAAARYYSMREIADEVGSREIREAFSGEDAVEIMQSQSSGGYVYTLMGIAPGKILVGYGFDTEELKDMEETDVMYAVVAVEKEDGTPWDKEEFFEKPLLITPLFEGLEPWQFNMTTMNGGYYAAVIDGVGYRIIHCDDIEMFADRRILLAIMDSIFYNSKAFEYDEKTGAITRNEDYEGTNLLFELPLDESKADPEAAEAYIQKLRDDVD